MIFCCCGKKTCGVCSCKDGKKYDFVFLICNSNAAKDDEWDLTLNGYNFGNVSELGIDRCQGKYFYTSKDFMDWIIRDVNNDNSPNVDIDRNTYCGTVPLCCLRQTEAQQEVPKNAFTFCNTENLDMEQTKRNFNGNFGNILVWRRTSTQGSSTSASKDSDICLVTNTTYTAGSYTETVEVPINQPCCSCYGSCEVPEWSDGSIDSITVTISAQDYSIRVPQYGFQRRRRKYTDSPYNSNAAGVSWAGEFIDWQFIPINAEWSENWLSIYNGPLGRNIIFKQWEWVGESETISYNGVVKFPLSKLSGTYELVKKEGTDGYDNPTPYYEYLFEEDCPCDKLPDFSIQPAVEPYRPSILFNPFSAFYSADGEPLPLPKCNLRIHNFKYFYAYGIGSEPIEVDESSCADGVNLDAPNYSGAGYSAMEFDWPLFQCVSPDWESVLEEDEVGKLTYRKNKYTPFNTNELNNKQPIPVSIYSSYVLRSSDEKSGGYPTAINDNGSTVFIDTLPEIFLTRLTSNGFEPTGVTIPEQKKPLTGRLFGGGISCNRTKTALWGLLSDQGIGVLPFAITQEMRTKTYAHWDANGWLFRSKWLSPEDGDYYGNLALPAQWYYWIYNVVEDGQLGTVTEGRDTGFRVSGMFQEDGDPRVYLDNVEINWGSGGE